MTIAPTEDGKLVSYQNSTDKFVLIDPPNTFPEAPNTNQGYLRKTTAGVGSWELLANDTEYSTTKAQVQTNSGDIVFLQGDVNSLQN